MAADVLEVHEGLIATALERRPAGRHEGLIATALERRPAGRLVERSGGRRTRALRCAVEPRRRRSRARTNRVCCPRNLDEGPWKPQQGDTAARARGRQRTCCRGAPRAGCCRRAARGYVARRSRAEWRSRGAGQGHPGGQPRPAPRLGRGSQQPRRVGTYCHCPGRRQTGPPAGCAADSTRRSRPRCRGLGTAQQGRRQTAVWCARQPPHTECYLKPRPRAEWKGQTRSTARFRAS